MKKYNSIAEIEIQKKNKMAGWAYEIYSEYCYEQNGIPIDSERINVIIKRFKEKLLKEQIMLNDKQIMVYYYSKQPGFQKRIAKELH